ncbi:zinc finger protein 764-like [Engraulis encrasicolus]|uniref:zinc finger protein 764-like n=1 Tax=Engraulis encrasicolus TaxID=184585 RepID=UPI002FD531DF
MEDSELELSAAEWSESELCKDRVVTSPPLPDSKNGLPPVSHSNALPLPLATMTTASPSWPLPLSSSPITIKQEEEEEDCSGVPEPGPLLPAVTTTLSSGGVSGERDRDAMPPAMMPSSSSHMAGAVSFGRYKRRIQCLDPPMTLTTALSSGDTGCGDGQDMMSSSLSHGAAAAVAGPFMRYKRRIQCLQCGKSFDRQSHYERHRRIHTGERPYGCSVCGRRFTQKSNLKGHLRTHSDEKRYHCPGPFATVKNAFSPPLAASRHY